MQTLWSQESGLMYEIKNSRRIELSDKIRFRCIRCGACCRNVEGAVVIEAKDGYYLAKHLGVTVPEFYEKYTQMFLLEEVDFPIFTLKTGGKDNACVFLKGKRCIVQNAKPRTCKMYPFWIHPDDSGGFVYNLSTEQRHHPKGSLIRVKDWMRDNLSEEDKEFLSEEARAISEIAPLYNILQKSLKDNTTLIEKIIFYRHFLYDTDESFMPQFQRNNRVLKEELERIINKYTDIDGGNNG